jgi:hypothetical protein
MSMEPRLAWRVSRMLFSRVLPVEPPWMFMAQRPSAATKMVLFTTRLPVEGPPASIWYRDMPEAWAAYTRLLAK